MYGAWGLLCLPLHPFSLLLKYQCCATSLFWGARVVLRGSWFLEIAEQRDHRYTPVRTVFNDRLNSFA